MDRERGQVLASPEYEAVPKLTVAKGKQSFTGIPGQTAYDCLRSMPFHADLAVKFIDEYMGYLQFQSTIEIIKSTSRSF